MQIKQFSGLKSLPPQYERFFKEQSQQYYFSGRHWFDTLARTTLTPDTSAYFLAGENDNREVLALMAGRQPAGQNGSFLSRRRIWGTSLASLTNHETPLYSVAASPDLTNPSETLQDFAEAICHQTGPWSLIDLGFLDPDGDTFKAMSSGFRSAGMVVRAYDYRSNWYEPTTGMSYADYVKSRSASVRKSLSNFGRKNRKLAKEHGITFDLILDEGGLDAAIDAYKTIHEASWKGVEQAPDFMAHFIRNAARAGALRLLVIRVDSRPAALELAIVSNGQATMMKTAYDPAFGKYSVGSIAIMKMMEHLLDVDHVREIDFGNDDDPYKKSWVTKRRIRWGITAFNPRSVTGCLNLSRDVAEGAARSGVRALRRGRARLKAA
ncbi:MAG: GNAT family N-acetyltransferase [Rhodospirillaceae bacterium]|nr:GNAT family N-acetyltransferase [Rhodospirillaceae bacterium]MBT5454971.1 GNAT family N-acetyltransferase [Rhodospirillaceae bacterium]